MLSFSNFINKIEILDRSLSSFLYNLLPHSFPFQNFFEILAPTGIATLLWIIIFVALIIFEEKNHKKFLPYFALSIILAFIITNLILKPIFMRPRPTNSSICPKDYSFPSGHATLSFAVASTLALFDKKRRFLYYSFATLIGYSRIYLGCHYFFDVLAGGILGMGIGKFLSILIKNSEKQKVKTKTRISKTK